MELYAGLKAAQYSIYAHVAPQVLDRAFAAERGRLATSMCQSEVQARFQRFVARIKIAHTRIAFPTAAYDRYLEKGGTAFPLTVRIDAGRVFVLRNRSGQADPAPGAEILRLDGIPMMAWRARLSRAVSADTPYLRDTILEYRLPAYLWQAQGRRRGYDLTIRTPSGVVRRLRIPARTPQQMEAATAARAPAFSLDPKRSARMLPGDLAYLRPGPFYNTGGGNEWDTGGFVAFVDSAFRQFNAAGAKTLLIDLRENPGGDSSFSDPMIAWFATRPFKFVSAFRVRISPQTIASNRKRLEAAAVAGVVDPVSPQFAALYAKSRSGEIATFDVPLVLPRDGERFAGKVYVLIDRYTYSNAVNVAAIVQDYRFGTILGEETADLATTQGAMESFVLPRTRIPVNYAKALLVRPSGSPASRGIVPDFAIVNPLAPDDDVMLAAAVERIRTQDREAYRHASR